MSEQNALTTAATSNYGSKILVRTIKPTVGGLSTDAARAMLNFRLAPDDTTVVRCSAYGVFRNGFGRLRDRRSSWPQRIATRRAKLD